MHTAYATAPVPDKQLVSSRAWPLARRLDWTWRKNPQRRLNARTKSGKDCPGSRRRSRLEHRVRGAQDQLQQRIRSGQLGRELHHLDRLRAELGFVAPSPARVRQLESLVASTGPSSGWAHVNERVLGPHGFYVVRLYVPPRRARQARQWLRWVRELLYQLARGAALAPKLLPALRGSSSQRHEEPLCREQQDLRGEVLAALERLKAKAGFTGAM